ncbi:uncharacterized protein PHACADRAFT_254886 [Phanerochaete carnosa HHB-10118-sp]|uniref:Uncharacterized protein n=1 Tax=Phanerochaete carnosa (strain HHB-10118-sp) TaxID=650164 RepID=K5W074_PHACS|nr:uncharacterized protein PHACADRAFT_254886 [Phanerochaete carnosa HHB-10118-sp]EKM57233.1 hypothetical protein PHACADRAFT_254886 [Phanerochaete carnosa HHB-10118-sp]
MSSEAPAPPTPPTHPEGRTRFVYQQWVRDPKGSLLTKPPPSGVRPPNDLIWGHTLDDFFWIQRIPNIDVLTIWSRSMIKEHGENYDESEFLEPDALQVPRLRHPWPVLKVPNDGIRVPKNSYGVIDQGCEKHSKPDFVAKRRDDSEPCLERGALNKAGRILKELFGFDDNSGSEYFVPNDPHYPLRSPDGALYAVLFASRFREEAFGSGRGALPPQTISLPQLTGVRSVRGNPVMLEFDEYGIYVTGDDTGEYADLFDSTEEGRSRDASPEGMQLDDPKVEAPSVDNSSRETSDTESKDEVEGKADDGDLATSAAGSELDDLSPSEPIPRDSPFSIQDIPKLEESIPHYYFPDILFVHDPHELTATSLDSYEDVGEESFEPRAPLVYKRVFPELHRDKARDLEQPTSPKREAHLHLAHQNRMGVGNHSLVYRAPLTLPVPLSAHSRNGKVTVAAKSAFPKFRARELLANEAKMYSRFPEHLSQDWCGYNLVTPIKHPVPVGPVVPKFFGYYVPTRGDGSLVDVFDAGVPSPVLLLEECGKPVTPGKFSADERQVAS